MSFYGSSRLPFARPGNSPNRSLQLAGATQPAADLSCSLNKALRPWLPCSSHATPAAADLSCSSNKALRPWQCPFMEVQGLPFARPGSSPNPSRAARRRHSGRGRPFLQPQQGPEAVASLQPEAVAVSFNGSSRLPFARPGTPQTLPCSSQAPLRPRQTSPAASTTP